MYKPKVFLGIITQNEEANVSEICQTAKYLDGIFGVVHQPYTDRTFEILDQNKGDGDIIKIPYLQRNDWSMNGFLFNPKFLRDYWCIILDSSERLAESFAKNIHNLILEMEKSNIYLASQYSKLLLFKKNDKNFFFGHPHWGVQGNEGRNCIRIEDYFSREDSCYSVRDVQRPKDHYILHFVKYYLHAGFSNHLLLGRENNIPEYQVHEEVRQKFIDYCLSVLKIELKPEALLEYIKKNGLNYELKWFINFEEILNTWYCYYVLGHSFEDVNSRREKKVLFNVA